MTASPRSPSLSPSRGHVPRDPKRVRQQQQQEQYLWPSTNEKNKTRYRWLLLCVSYCLLCTSDFTLFRVRVFSGVYVVIESAGVFVIFLLFLHLAPAVLAYIEKGLVIPFPRLPLSRMCAEYARTTRFPQYLGMLPKETTWSCDCPPSQHPRLQRQTVARAITEPLKTPLDH